MPDYFHLVNPCDLDDDARVKYFQYFNRGIKVFLKIHLLNRHTTMISQQWEHHDGSGHPKSLYGKQLSRESQILAICNLYHNLVYQLEETDYKLLKKRKDSYSAGAGIK